MRVTRRTIAGPTPAPLHVLPQLWARNTWAWSARRGKPVAARAAPRSRASSLTTTALARMSIRLRWRRQPELLFCDNDTNVAPPLRRGRHGPSQGRINDFVVDGATRPSIPTATRHQGRGACVPARSRPAARRVCAARLRKPRRIPMPFADFDALLRAPHRRGGRILRCLQHGIADADARLVQRQAFAGMLWSKQYLLATTCGAGSTAIPRQPAPPRATAQRTGRNADWRPPEQPATSSRCRTSGNIPGSPPGTWPSTASAGADRSRLRQVAALLLDQRVYMHPNGQLPAYEWAFGDVNPPVHAWAACASTRSTARRRGDGDRVFLERMFHKLLLNFTWWVNRKDADGRNIFQGGFLGLDNIGIFDRSTPLPTGGQHRPGRRHRLDGDVRADHDAHRARAGARQPRLRGHRDQVLRALPVTSPRRCMAAASAASTACGTSRTQFYYDVLRLPGRHPRADAHSLDGRADSAVRGRACSTELSRRLPEFARALRLVLRPPARSWRGWCRAGATPSDAGRSPAVAAARPPDEGAAARACSTRPSSCRRYGVRSLSRYHLDHPYVFELDGMTFCARTTSRAKSDAAFSAAIPTGAGRSGCRSTTC